MLKAEALKQLETLGYVDGDQVFLRAFSPEKGKDGGRNLEFVYPDVPASQLEQWQAEGRGVYLVVNQGGHSDDKIERCVAVFYEHDEVNESGLKKLQNIFPDQRFEKKPGSFDRDGKQRPPAWYVPKSVQQQLWVALELPEPTMQVDTGGKSIHNYWAFNAPIGVDLWKSLQSDLLEYADADRKLKNPSRVMRLAGCIHATGEPARIIGGNGQRYSFDQLRSIVPVAQIESRSGGKGITWAEFNQQWRFPISDSVPLESCLSRSNRELLSGGQSDGGRNDSGFKLATDLLAVTAFLTQEGQRFNGDPYALFLSYCQKCPRGDGWNQREWDLIWKSAQQKPRNSSLNPEQIEGCVKGWAWNNCPDRVQADVSSIGRSMPATRAAMLQDIPADATDEEKLRLTIANYNRVLDSGNRFQQIPLRRAIAKEWGLTVSEVDELSRALTRGQSGDLALLGDSMAATKTEIEQRSQGLADPGVASGFYDLDAMTQGFQRSDLVIVAARPSIGKTSLALNVTRHVAGQGLPVAVFSLEMSRQQLAYRLLSSEANIESGRLRSGRVLPNEWVVIDHAIGVLSGLPLYIDDTPAISVAEVRAKCRALQVQQGQLGLIMVDYLQLMDDGGLDRVQALDRITASLKALGRELNVPVIVLSQLSRGVESRNEKRPMMSDIRESGGVEQNADLIAMLYRDEYYNPDSTDRGIAELIIAKHRNGPVGTVKLLFDGQCTRFRNLARKEPASSYRSTPQNPPHQPTSPPSHAVPEGSEVLTGVVGASSGNSDNEVWEEVPWE